MTRALRSAVSKVSGVVRGEPTFNRLPNASAAVSGVIEVADAPAYERVLSALVDVLDRELGRSAADRATVYLTARVGAETVDPTRLGLPQKPTVADLRRRR